MKVAKCWPNCSFVIAKLTKFIILSFTTWGSNTSFGAVQLLKHTVASSSGGTIVFDIENATDTDHKFSVLPTFQTYIEISAGNYINFYLEQARAYGIVYGMWIILLKNRDLDSKNISRNSVSIVARL